MITVDLGNEPLFAEGEIRFETKGNYIYGRNGSGKSTLTRMIKEQITDFDVRVFQGFEKVLGENHQLNAVILGEKNIEIGQQIEEQQAELKKVEEQMESVRKNTREPEDDSENLWTRRKKAQDDYESLNRDIDGFYISSASEIKNMSSPQIAPTTYNKRNFKAEIQLAHLLSEDEMTRYKAVIHEVEKIAPDVVFPQLDFSNLLDEINRILVRKVKEHKFIARLQGNPEKAGFAKEGLRLHKAGDICAFCGNVISEETIRDLKSYFDADEVKSFQQEIENEITDIGMKIESIEQIDVDSDSFYPVFQQEASLIAEETEKRKSNWVRFLNKVKEQLESKKKILFESGEVFQYGELDDFSDIDSHYKELIRQNNGSNLRKMKDSAKDSLRFYEIQKMLTDWNYTEKNQNLVRLSGNKEAAEEAYEKEFDKIQPGGEIYEQKKKIEQSITSLKSSTQNEEIMAEHINEKLKHMVSFELIHEGQEGHGYYKVKSTLTNKVRDITDISTGEKNIIAFLYFVEKLNEVTDRTSSMNKLVVFDDPMNSNDNNMQYLMMDELQRLFKRLSDDDVLVVFTHNRHFYINMLYEKNKKVRRFHLETDGSKTYIRQVDREHDFKTSYDSLWQELHFLFDSNAAPELLLNPIRRIIETYVKFNRITAWDFCHDEIGACKMFNVNSHSIDDLEAELNGKTKQEIMDIMKRCFENNGASGHFDAHWNITG